jgi:hypothetical protein
MRYTERVNPSRKLGSDLGSELSIDNTAEENLSDVCGASSIGSPIGGTRGVARKFAAKAAMVEDFPANRSARRKSAQSTTDGLHFIPRLFLSDSDE